MIKTKCIFKKVDDEDGFRICVMRFVKDFYRYDLWLRDLAPSVELLNDWNNGTITWEEYEERYLEEIGNERDPGRMLDMDTLMGIIKQEKVVTLLCAEKEDTYCHRRLLKEYVEESIGDKDF